MTDGERPRGRRAPIQILLVEDVQTDARLIEDALQRAQLPVDLERVETLPALRDALRTPWDVVLCDWHLAGFTALTALAAVRAAGQDVPFIIVSGQVGEALAVDAMRAGAQDYVQKDNLARLGPAIERELRDHAVRRQHQNQESWFRALIEKSAEAVVATRFDGTMRYASPACAVVLGHLPAALVDTHVLELLHPEDRPAFAATMAQVHKHRTNTDAEHRVRRGDGELRWMAFTWTNLLDDPAVQAVIVNIRDVTERRRADEALRVAEEQLRQAQKMEAIGLLAGGVAHDFNNVLSVILSYAEMMIDAAEPDDPRRADLSEIQRAGHRAADLTRQLLMFSRQQVVAPRNLDLNRVVASAEKMLRRLIGEDVQLVTTLASDLGTIHADPSSIEQVIMNLVVNARDAMPTGGRIAITTANATLAGRPVVLLVVSDTGIGMDAATQARVFEPFFTTKDRDKGTGLGLATVFGIVTHAGGTLQIESEPGAGATFRIYLPRVEGEHEPAAAAPATPSGGTETILLVEDERQVRGVARQILEAQGYTVLEASGASDALAWCARYREPIHLLVTDVVMPEVGGGALAGRVVALRPGIRSLFMSDDRIIRHGIASSSVAFLQKPFTPESLAAKVREVLDATD